MVRRSQGGPSRKPALSIPRDRDWVILVIMLVFFGAILLRLGFIQIVKASEYAADAATSHTTEVTLSARRGTIYDRNGEVIASNIDATTIYVNPKEVKDPSALATVIEKVLGKKYDMKYEDYYKLVTTANTSFVYIQRKATTQIADRLKQDLSAADLEGVHYLDDTKRVYPNGGVGSQAVGAVDPDDNGIAGLELEYNSLLSGTNGSMTVERGLQDIPMTDGTLSETPAVDGSDIVTSLDVKLQQCAEKSLKKAIEKYSALGGTATVMDASTGEIYAACSFSKQTTKDDAGKKTTSYGYDIGKLASISDTYEPGSTFKAMTASAILERSAVTANTEFQVPGKLKVYDSTVRDSHAHGTETLSLRQIIAQSSNIGTVLASRKVSLSDLHDYYSAYGFGSNPGVDFPGSANGLLADSSSWNGVLAADITFGQGIAVTPLQILRAYAAIEQGGVLHVPHFLIDVPNDQTKKEKLCASFAKTSQPIKTSTAKTLTSMLESVVKNGTGTAAKVDGFTVAGKTGTAQKATSSGTYSNSDYIVSFCGWLSKSNSNLVCLVTMDSPQTAEGGGPVCGPVFADIMSFAADRYQVAPNTD